MNVATRSLAWLLSAVLVATAGCAALAGHGARSSRSRPMAGSGWLVCAAPFRLPGTVVKVVVADRPPHRGTGRTAGPTGPMGPMPRMHRMTLTAAPGHVEAGRVSLVVENLGSLVHEVVVVPLRDGQVPGGRAVGPDLKVAEEGSQGEASASCGPGAGTGVEPRTVGWVTLDLAAGSYELLCNLPGHYARGMYAGLVVSPR